MSTPEGALVCLPVTGIGEVREGDDLAGMLRTAADLRDGDVLVVTSKVVSKAEGRTVAADRGAALAEETDRVVATRGATTIVRTHHGLVMAAAGVDASNTEPGTVVLLPRDPDASARRLRERIAEDGGPDVAVVISDTSGRAWRTGQTDIAVGAAGLEVLHDHSGRTDPYGNELAVTAPAVADELAGAADLVTGKLSRCPAAVVRGLARLVLPAGEHGPGAQALVRPEEQDMFGLGAREAVLQAVREESLRGFGTPAPPEVLATTLEQLAGGGTVTVLPGEVRVRLAPGDDSAGRTHGDADEGARRLGAARRTGALVARLEAVAFACGWPRCSDDAEADATGSADPLRFRPATP